MISSRPMFKLQLHVRSNTDAETVHHVSEDKRIFLRPTTGSPHLLAQDDWDADRYIQCSAHRIAPDQLQLGRQRSQIEQRKLHHVRVAIDDTSTSVWFDSRLCKSDWCDFNRNLDRYGGLLNAIREERRLLRGNLFIIVYLQAIFAMISNLI